MTSSFIISPKKTSASWLLPLNVRIASMELHISGVISPFAREMKEAPSFSGKKGGTNVIGPAMVMYLNSYFEAPILNKLSKQR